MATSSYIIVEMRAVGIRDLKNRLSEYLRLVKSGQNLLVTDRGEVVAELRPPGHGAVAERPALGEMIAQGKLRVGAPNDPAYYPRLETAMSHRELMRILDEQRGEG